MRTYISYVLEFLPNKRKTRQTLILKVLGSFIYSKLEFSPKYIKRNGGHPFQTFWNLSLCKINAKEIEDVCLKYFRILERFRIPPQAMKRQDGHLSKTFSNPPVHNIWKGKKNVYLKDKKEAHLFKTSLNPSGL